MATVNLMYEVNRITFYFKRDGADVAIAKLKEMCHIYRKAALAMKTKHGRNHPYRLPYLESALSCRHLARIGFVQTLIENNHETAAN